MKYTINGKTVVTEQPLSEAEIDEIAATISPKTGLASLGDEGTPTAADPSMAVPSPSERMYNNALTGAAAVPIIGAGARALQLASRGSKAAPYLTNLANAVLPTSGRALVAEGVIGAGSGVVGGELGQATAQKLGESYRSTGELIGGAVGGMASNLVARNIPDLLTGLFSSKKAGAQALGDTAQMLGSIRAQYKLQTAMEANPSLAKDLESAADITSKTGITLPITAASRGDTTLSGLLTSETSRGENAAFTALIATQQKNALEAVAKAQKELASSPNRVEALARLKAAKDNAVNVKAEADYTKRQLAAQEQLDSIDERVADLSASALGTGEGKLSLSEKMKNLLDTKKALVKKDFSPLYENLLTKASAEGVVLDSPVVASLWKGIKDAKADDVFAKFPALYTKVQATLAPKQKPVSSSFAAKYPNLVKTAEGSYAPLEVKDIDSLKRAINKALGSTKDDDQIRMLSSFKQSFDTAVSSIEGDFPTAYKALDNAYAQKLGIPFSENGVLAFDRARFIENTVPNLTSTPSAIKQLLAATDNSPETAKVIEDAFLVKLSTSPGILNPTTQQINVPSLNLFIKKNSEALDAVPGLKDKLLTVGADVKALQGTRTRVLEMQKSDSVNKIETAWMKSQNTSGGFQGYVQGALKRPEQIDELLLLAGTDKTLKRGLKSAVLDIGLSSGDKAEFFTANADAFNKLFGKGQAEKIKLILDASDRLAQFPVSTRINPSLTQKTKIQEMSGSSPEQLAAEARNPILGKFRMLSNVLSRYTQNAATKSESAEIQAFLADPKAVGDAAAVMEALTGKTASFTQKTLATGKRLLSNTGTAALFGGLASAGAGEAGLTIREETIPFEE